MRRAWRLSAALICFAPGAFAQIYSMELTAPPPGPSMGGVYISPYTALIGAPGQTVPVITGTSTPVICDDFTTEVSVNTAPWQALKTNLSALTGETTPDNNLKFDQGSGLATAQQQIFDYTVAAYLAIQIMQAQALGQTTKQGQLSFALWGLFDPTPPDPTGPLSGAWITGTTPGTNLFEAKKDLQDAKNAVTAGGGTPDFIASLGYSVDIYTPTPIANQGASQEYLTVVAMPEPSSWAILGFDLLATIGLLRFVVRRRAARVS
jgi:hypothetical protein